MPTTYTAVIDEMFAKALTVFQTEGAAILGYEPDVRWPGAPDPGIPARELLWARVSAQVADDMQCCLANYKDAQLFEATGHLIIELYCPRNVGGSIDKGRLVAVALQAGFRQPSLSGELWYRHQKVVELIEKDEAYSIHIIVQFTYRTLTLGNVPVVQLHNSDITGQHGTMSSSGLVLSTSVPLDVVNVSQAGSSTFLPSLGTITLNLPALATGDVVNGGTIVSGGSIVIDVPTMSIHYVGAFGASQWLKLTLANGTHKYFLQGALVSGQGNGGFAMTTENIGSGVWTGSAPIHDMQIHIV